MSSGNRSLQMDILRVMGRPDLIVEWNLLATFDEMSVSSSLGEGPSIFTKC